MKLRDEIIKKLSALLASGRFEELESDTIEFKPTPPDRVQWKEIQKSVNAFLNTRGGVIVLGVKEEKQGPDRKYVFSGYQAHAENGIKELPNKYSDRQGRALNLTECFRPPEIVPFQDGNLAFIYVDELPADEKFCFLEGRAYKRHLTGDHELTKSEIESREEFKTESLTARELQLLESTSLDDIDLAKINDYIQRLNQAIQIETIKSEVQAALPFLIRKCFVKDGKLTTLGALVCGKFPGDLLGFRAHVHGYVDIPHEIAQDKQDLIDNILQLMDRSLAYVMRNIMVGVSAEGGGKEVPQYPEELLRETINNALAHRDYSINKQIIVSIKPAEHISIRNPGGFRRHLLIESMHEPPVLRIIPEAKPRNPKLADVLRVYRKWEGKGIGMATLVNYCLQDKLDLPYYRFYSEEVSLFILSGNVLDEGMKRRFESFDRYIEEKLNGNKFTTNQGLVLSYLIKSEWANRLQRHTILLTPDNNHFEELAALEQCGLIYRHRASTELYPVYVADRTLLQDSHSDQLRQMFGASFDTLDQLNKDVLNTVYRHQYFSKNPQISAKKTSFYIWYAQERNRGDIKAFDVFYRKVRLVFNALEKSGLVIRPLQKKSQYLLNPNFKREQLV